jgi:diguanylate cyclase (GGDEF)-like protein
MEHLTKKSMRILVVDTHVRSSERLSNITATASAKGFPDCGFDYEVTYISEHPKALITYQTFHPDLVLIDLSEQTQRGKDLCRTIREVEQKRHTGIIFLAMELNEPTEDFAVECLELGADDVLRSGITDREVFARINAVLKLKVMTDELRSANHRLHQLSYTDDLTGLANMRAFNGRYSKAIGDCVAGKHPLGVIMLDLDNFKLVNDANDHLMGSHVISEVGRLIRVANILDPNDCAARFGGDEYVIFTTDTDLDTITKKGEEIRAMIDKAIFIKDGRSVSVTSSIGVSWTAPGYRGKAEDPIKAADMMLYQSKRLGRNMLSSMTLRNPVDLDHIGRGHLTDGDSSSDDDDIARINNL